MVISNKFDFTIPDANQGTGRCPGSREGGSHEGAYNVKLLTFCFCNILLIFVQVFKTFVLCLLYNLTSRHVEMLDSLLST